MVLKGYQHKPKPALMLIYFTNKLLSPIMFTVNLTG